MSRSGSLESCKFVIFSSRMWFKYHVSSNSKKSLYFFQTWWKIFYETSFFALISTLKKPSMFVSLTATDSDGESFSRTSRQTIRDSHFLFVEQKISSNQRGLEFLSRQFVAFIFVLAKTVHKKLSCWHCSVPSRTVTTETT